MVGILAGVQCLVQMVYLAAMPNAEAVGVPVVVVVLVGVTMTGLIMFGVTIFGDVTLFGGDCVGDAVLDTDDVFGGNPEDAGRG